MELDAAQSRAVRNRYAATSVKSIGSAVKLWVVFCRDFLDIDSIVLFRQPPAVPTSAEVRVADLRLTLFANWLDQQYASATTSQYVSGIKQKHTDWLGGSSLAELGVLLSRVTARLAIARKRKPGRKREKVPFSADLLADCLSFLWCRGPFWHQRCTTYAVMALCMEHLLRLSETAHNRADPMTAASANPIRVCDVEFFDVNDQPVALPRSLADGWLREPNVHSMKCRMPPSKADPGGQNAPLFSPAGSPWLRSFLSPVPPAPLAVRWPVGTPVPARRAVGACRAIWALLAIFPVKHSARHLTPLFANAKGSSLQLAKRTFMKYFGEAMKDAGHEDYKKYGQHCFRVRGAVALQDAGASGPQVAAHGHWRSDIWQLYNRRGKADSLICAGAIMQPSPTRGRPPPGQL